jgi:hypothetical protein
VSETLAGRGLLGKKPPLVAGVRNPVRNRFVREKPFFFSRCQKF